MQSPAIAAGLRQYAWVRWSLLAPLLAAAALGPAATAAELTFTHLSVEQGLSDNQAWPILRDRQGFMWFGTQLGGLDRHDGYEFKVYRHDPADPHSLAHNFVWALHEDRDGTLWVGTNGGGLDRYDRGREGFVHHRHDPRDPRSLPHDGVTALFEDRRGVLWVGS